MRGDGLLVPDLAVAPPRKASLLPVPPHPRLWADTWRADKVVQQSYDASLPMVLIAVALTSLKRDPFWDRGAVLGHSRCSVNTCRAKLGSGEQKFLPRDPSVSLPLASSCFPFT